MHILWSLVQQGLPSDVRLPANISHLGTSSFACTITFRVHLQVLHKWLHNTFCSNMQQHRLHHRKVRQQSLLNSPWNREAFKAIRSNFVPPL
eukprot:4092020-Karenia_brevis.AAC.1